MQLPGGHQRLIGDGVAGAPHLLEPDKVPGRTAELHETIFTRRPACHAIAPSLRAPPFLGSSPTFASLAKACRRGPGRHLGMQLPSGDPRPTLSLRTRRRHKDPGSHGRLPIGDARDTGRTHDARAANHDPSRRHAPRAGEIAPPQVPPPTAPARLVVIAPAEHGHPTGARRAPAARPRPVLPGTRTAPAREYGDSAQR